MAAVPIVEEILDNAPDLHLVPEWAPEPDQPSFFHGIGRRASWSDVFQWTKDGYNTVFYGGNEFSQTTQAMLQNAIDAAVGQTIKALSGFIDQNAAMTVQAASLLEDSINNLESDELNDFRTLSERLDQIEAVQNLIVSEALPSLQAQVNAAKADAYAFALAAQQNANQWATDNIFRPLYDSIFALQAETTNAIQASEQRSTQYTNQVNGQTILHDAEALAPVAAAVQALQSWVDDCGEPMCQTQGPKTDLGKLLKALSLATDVALFADLASMTEPELVAKVKEAIAAMGGVIHDFEGFLSGGGTIGSTIASAVGAAL